MAVWLQAEVRGRELGLRPRLYASSVCVAQRRRSCSMRLVGLCKCFDFFQLTSLETVKMRSPIVGSVVIVARPSIVALVEKSITERGILLNATVWSSAATLIYLPMTTVGFVCPYYGAVSHWLYDFRQDLSYTRIQTLAECFLI